MSGSANIEETAKEIILPLSLLEFGVIPRARARQQFCTLSSADRYDLRRGMQVLDTPTWATFFRGLPRHGRWTGCVHKKAGRAEPATTSTDRNLGAFRLSQSSGRRWEGITQMGQVCPCCPNWCVLCHGFHITKYYLTFMNSTFGQSQPEGSLFPLRCCQSYFQETSIPPSLTETATTAPSHRSTMHAVVPKFTELHQPAAPDGLACADGVSRHGMVCLLHR